MKKHKIAVLLLFVMGAKGYGEPHPYFGKTEIAGEVQAAHESYLSGKFDEMAGHIEKALFDSRNDAKVVNNLMELYDGAYDQRGYEAIHPDWKLPPDILWMSLGS